MATEVCLSAGTLPAFLMSPPEEMGCQGLLWMWEAKLAQGVTSGCSSPLLGLLF